MAWGSIAKADKRIGSISSQIFGILDIECVKGSAAIYIQGASKVLCEICIPDIQDLKLCTFGKIQGTDGCGVCLPVITGIALDIELLKLWQTGEINALQILEICNAESIQLGHAI